jgi:hypothetical protein
MLLRSRDFKSRRIADMRKGRKEGRVLVLVLVATPVWP